MNSRLAGLLLHAQAHPQLVPLLLVQVQRLLQGVGAALANVLVQGIRRVRVQVVFREPVGETLHVLVVHLRQLGDGRLLIVAPHRVVMRATLVVLPLDLRRRQRVGDKVHQRPPESRNHNRRDNRRHVNGVPRNIARVNLRVGVQVA